MSQRENAIGALFAVLGQLSLGATVKRNAALPERVSDQAMAILRDGEMGEPEVSLSPLDLGSMWGSLFPSAQGNVFEGPALSAYRNTVVDRPTLFPFAQGAGFASVPRIGLMGEKSGSPGEAIMPLTRMRDGDLGVKVHGGGSTVIVNVIEAAGKGGQQQQRTDSNGNQVIDVWVEQITAKVWGDVARGAGPGPGVLANTYGLNRVAGAY